MSADDGYETCALRINITGSVIQTQTRATTTNDVPIHRVYYAVKWLYNVATCAVFVLYAATRLRRINPRWNQQVWFIHHVWEQQHTRGRSMRMWRCVRRLGDILQEDRATYVTPDGWSIGSASRCTASQQGVSWSAINFNNSIRLFGPIILTGNLWLNDSLIYSCTNYNDVNPGYCRESINDNLSVAQRYYT